MRSRGCGLVLFALGLAGCPSTTGDVDMASPDLAVPEPEVKGTVTPQAGGSLKSADGQLEVKVPPGAVDAPTELRLQRLPASEAVGTVPEGVGYELGPEGTTFAKPVTLAWTIPSADLPKDGSGRTPLVVLWTLSAAGQGEILTAQQMTLGSPTTVSAETSHFSRFYSGVMPVYGSTSSPAVVDVGESGMGTLSLSLGATLEYDSVTAWFLKGQSVYIPFVINDYRVVSSAPSILDAAPGESLVGRTLSEQALEIMEHPVLQCRAAGDARWHVEVVGRFMVPAMYPSLDKLKMPVTLTSLDENVRCHQPPDMTVPRDLTVLPPDLTPPPVDMAGRPMITSVNPDHGSVGDEIHVLGINLGGATGELVLETSQGPILITPISAGQTEIVFAVPAAAPPGRWVLRVITKTYFNVDEADFTVDALPDLGIPDPPDMAMPPPPPDLAVDNCSFGWLDCNGNPGDGCETNPSFDTGNCGACGKVCDTFGASGSTCIAGTCIPNCVSGWADCDGKPENGCETGTSSNMMNCGGCGQVCEVPHVITDCVGGRCELTRCEPYWADCDMDQSNGCEQSLTDDKACGYCGMQCPMGSSCTTINGATYACY